VLFINRNVEYVAYGASARFITPDLSEAEQKFNEASLKERGKFKRETLSNFGGRLRRDKLADAPTGGRGRILTGWIGRGGSGRI
jgi:uncharacterized membrane protein